MIQVFLVDDQTLVRQGVKSLLSLAPDIKVVAEASDGQQAIDLIPEIKPDVVLMDMRMPVKSGLEAVQELSAAGRLPPTIILTTFDDDDLVLAGVVFGDQRRGAHLDAVLEPAFELVEVRPGRIQVAVGGDQDQLVIVIHARDSRRCGPMGLGAECPNH